ncbi:uncharacterized protein PG986_008842 [Apiospora aurea]|uniref:Uncharacterized protein n=1 Tax=Apiospora aurea TaxID=335848 RepID=A0ABR1Q5X6_9PEZI
MHPNLSFTQQQLLGKMVNHKVLEEVLHRLHPAVAEQRLAQIATDAQLLKALPFNGDHLDQLRRLLQSVVRNGRLSAREVADLHLHAWPDRIVEAMVEGLQPSLSPVVSDEELHLVCLRFLNAKSISVLKHPAFASDSNNGFERYYDTLEQQFRVHKKDTSDRLVQKMINRIIHKVTPAQRETLYYALIFVSGCRPPYLPSQILQLAMACDADVAKQAVPHLDFSCQSPPVKKVVAFLKRSRWTIIPGVGKRMDPHATAELFELLQRLDRLDIDVVSTAIRRAHARLLYMPRFLSQNYLAALWRDSEDLHVAWQHLESDIIGDHFANRRKEVEPLLKGLVHACYSGFDKHRMVPSSLLDPASRDLVIDLNNAVIEYLKDKGWDYQGELIFKNYNRG